MNRSLRRRLSVVVLAFALVGAQWLLGRGGPASACGTTRCFAPQFDR